MCFCTTKHVIIDLNLLQNLRTNTLQFFFRLGCEECFAAEGRGETIAYAINDCGGEKKSSRDKRRSNNGSDGLRYYNVATMRRPHIVSSSRGIAPNEHAGTRCTRIDQNTYRVIKKSSKNLDMTVGLSK